MVKNSRLATKWGLIAGGCLAMATPASAAAPAAPATRVGFDAHSFLLDGKRLYLWSGEFHPYRLPSPALWRDVLERMKAAGLNTTSIYFSWGYHSAAPGRYDFTGIRDMDRLLDIARDVGIYVIARPGPYINAEVDSGGFPLWFTTKPFKNRSPDPAYLAAADEWLTAIDRVIAHHQVDGNKGTVIAYQVENEYYNGSPEGQAYMAHLKAKARADGITVPLVGNHNGTFLSGPGAMEVSGWDHYPQGFDCSHPGQWKPAPDMAAEHGPGQPIFAAEYQGGAFDPWGGPGYARCAQLINDRFASVFYKSNIAAGATAQNFYMGFGGTSWGWQAIPQNYTSYDYGAAITEWRRFEPKYWELKRMGAMLAASPELRSADAAMPARVDDPAVVDLARRDAATGAEFHLLRHGDSTATERSAVHLALAFGADRYDRMPQRPGTAVVLDGRQAKLLPVNRRLGATQLVYATSELMTVLPGARDVALLYGDAGTDGELVLRFKRRPKVTVIAGAIDQAWERGHDLRLNYRHEGTSRVLVEGDGHRLLLLLADTHATERAWVADVGPERVLLLGGALLRGAEVKGGTLALRGDGGAVDEPAILFATTPAVSWNGAPIATEPTPDGGRRFTISARVAFTVPPLGPWQARAEAPEAQPGFADQDWMVADHQTTASVTKPGSLPVLFADDYGFHVGHSWYRGHFAGGRTAPTGVALKVQSGGGGGAFSVWLNGHYLGGLSGTDEARFGFPAAALRPGDNVISVLTVDMGHEEDYQSSGENRTARGLVMAVPQGAAPDAIRWRIQGRRGGEGATDPLRGPYNEGGLFGEREGWHLGKGGEAGWQPASLPVATMAPGVTWYRSNVTLDLPAGRDASLGLRFRDPPGRHYRATLFVNGWQFGNYVADLGPQHDFPIPEGVLNHHGANQIAIAVWKVDATPGGLGEVELIDADRSPPVQAGNGG